MSLKLICCGWGAAAAVLIGSAPAFADAAPGPRPVVEIADCTNGGDVETADTALLEAVEQQLKAGGGFVILKQRRPELEAALAHAPAVLHRMELCGDAIVVHTEGTADTLLGLAQAANLMKDQATLDKALHGRPRPVKAVARQSPYVRISFYVGAVYNEDHQFDRALAALNKGLVLSPDDPIVVNEAAQALIFSHRPAEAQALCERALASDRPMSGQERGLLYRTRGFALGEQNRFAEAEQSYRDSLTYDAGNRGALNEIRYYQMREGGAPGGPAKMTTANKFKQGAQPVAPQTPQPNS